MSLQTVSGSLRDFAGVAPGLDPQLIFKPSGAAVAGDGGVLFSRQIVVTPASDGTWSDQFESTEDLLSEAWYSVSIRWFEAGPTPDTGGYVDYDFPAMKLFVPAEGGPFNFADIVQSPTNPNFLFIQPDPPPNPSAGTLWIDSDDPDALTLGLPLYEWV